MGGGNGGAGGGFESLGWLPVTPGAAALLMDWPGLSGCRTGRPGLTATARVLAANPLGAKPLA